MSGRQFLLENGCEGVAKSTTFNETELYITFLHDPLNLILRTVISLAKFAHERFLSNLQSIKYNLF